MEGNLRGLVVMRYFAPSVYRGGSAEVLNST